MKLHNKKTGEIFEGGFILIPSSSGFIGNPSKSVAEVNEEWEDYEPKPPEPLIDDERFRKAVRAWAEANSIKKAHYLEMPERILCILTDKDDRDYEIGFVGHIPTLEDGEDYTIAELCGEEEE